MTAVAVMTQPLRAIYCAAYLHQIPESVPIRIITPDDRVMTSLDLPERAEFRRPLSKARSVPTSSISRSRLRQGVVRWARGGSTWGMRFDRAIRSTIWRLRYVDRLVALRDLRKSQLKSLFASHKAITDMLSEIQRDEEISQLIVFDVFDLPPVLAFGETHSIPVSVR